MWEFLRFFFFGPDHVQIALWGALVPLAASALGGLFNKGQKSSGTQATVGTTTTTPNYDPTQLAFRSDIVGNLLNQMQNPLDVSGYEATGLEDINQAANLNTQQTREELAARGIRGPALDFALRNIENQRYGQSARFRSGIPMLSNQLRSQAIQNAAQFFTSMPTGQTQTVNSRTSQAGTMAQPGSATGSMLGQVGPVLGYLYGQGAFSKPPAVVTTPSTQIGTPWQQ